MTRYIATGDLEWINADKIASIRVVDRRYPLTGGRGDGTYYDVVALLDGATWDADREAWTATFTIAADYGDYADDRDRATFAVDLARHLVAWLVDHDNGVYDVNAAAVTVECALTGTPLPDRP
jgi:hypothetical protein